ncbi:MAG: LacI family DNA-binding transcriptional regulator, partial [Lachnospiraceae bacterium]|nr:LacI family DNA-binding transcriptional regulator [Lachnospiraceae bacterium]
MMDRKVTIKDVAREAGVSVATVSYVVNQRTDLRISDATRKKVLQVINLLNYTPNQAAKA